MWRALTIALVEQGAGRRKRAAKRAVDGAGLLHHSDAVGLGNTQQTIATACRVKHVRQNRAIWARVRVTRAPARFARARSPSMPASRMSLAKSLLLLLFTEGNSTSVTCNV